MAANPPPASRPAPAPSARPRLHRIDRTVLSGLLLLGLAGALAAARLHTFEEPLERDITTYAVIGHEMLAGRRLYSDLWDHKPPAIHVTYAAAELLAGYGPGEVYLLTVAAGIAAMLAVWTAALGCTRSRAAAAGAAALWVAASGDLALQGNQPNTEAFLNVFLTWGLALLVWPEREAPQRWRLAAAGAAFALASLYKPVAVAVPAALASVMLVAAVRRGAGLRRVTADIGLLAAPGVVAWAALCGWFAATARLGDLFSALVTFNRAYAGNLPDNILAGLAPVRLLPLRLAALAVLAAGTALAALVLAVARVRGRAAEGLSPAPHRAGALLAAFAAGIAATVMLPGHYYPHYYQLWVPILAVTSAWALAGVAATPGVAARGAALVGGAALLAALLVVEIPTYLLSPEEWSARKYGPTFVATRRAAATIDALLAPGETFYEWGAETGLYFYTRRDPPTGVFFNFPLLQGPLARALSARVIRDLTARPPELVVVGAPDVASFSEPVLAWVAARYVALPAGAAHGAGYLLARRGGALAARVRAAGSR